MKNVENISIVGAGTMGSSLAKIFKDKGYSVILYDISPTSLDNAKKLISNNYTIKNNLDKPIGQGVDVSPSITFTNDISKLGNTDFMVEAISENMELKHEFWEKASTIVPDDAILTSNTSGLSITEISNAVSGPGRFGGMHWINPPDIIPLVEVISGKHTTKKTTDIIYNIALSLGKKPVYVNDAPGFVLNRIQFAIMRECLNIVERGIASKEAVDDVMKYGLGFRYACLGPFRIADLGGLDVFYNIASYLYGDLSNASEPSDMLKDVYENGRFGVKNGQGFYDYSYGKDFEIIEYRDKIFNELIECLYKK